jgi:NTP pyrophosphatase (non-canonical NTP hydrolase)
MSKMNFNVDGSILGASEWEKGLAKEVRSFYEKKSKGKVTMDFTEYQKKALSTAIYPKEMAIIYPALGLAGEAGEVADKVKKIVRDNNTTDEFKQNIAAEIGDVLWYCAVLANDLGFDLAHVANINLTKLADRLQRGVLQGSGDKR